MSTYNFNSVTNQRIKGHFVDREVYACISDFAEYLFDYDGEKYASYDEWDNMWITRCPECGEVIVWDECEMDEENESDVKHVCPHCEAEINDEPENEPQDIMEYWLVSSWLGEKLKAKGELILERYGAWIWGRCCSGQAILLDSVISSICSDLEILEGQPHDWSKQGVA